MCVCLLYLTRRLVRHLLVQGDVEVVAVLVGEEQADGDGLAVRCEPDVDLELSLKHSELPQTPAVTHHHGADRFLNLTAHTHTHTHEYPLVIEYYQPITAEEAGFGLILLE